MAVATKATIIRIVLLDEIVGHDIATTHVLRTCARPIKNAAKSTDAPPPLTYAVVPTEELLHESAVARLRRQGARSADLSLNGRLQHHSFVGRVGVAVSHCIWLNAEIYGRTWLNARCCSLSGPEDVGPSIDGLGRARWGLQSTG